MEYAQMFRRFGCEVSMIIMEQAFLSKEDEDIAASLEEVFKEEGIKIYLNAKSEKIKKTTDGVISLTLVKDTKKMTIEGSDILLAAGCIPQTNTLQLEKTGVTTNAKGFINVDEYLQTSEPGIYALGDVKGGPAFTHISYNDYIILTKNIIHHLNVSIK